MSLKQLTQKLKQHAGELVTVTTDARGERVRVAVADTSVTITDLYEMRAVLHAIPKDSWTLGMHMDTAPSHASELLCALLKDVRLAEPLELHSVNGNNARMIVTPEPGEEGGYFVELFAPDAEDPYTSVYRPDLPLALRWGFYEADEQFKLERDEAYCEERDYAEFTF
jgi:hypothetical protein